LALKRLQHTGFGKEIKALLGSKHLAERELAGIVASELDAMAKMKDGGGKHPKEEVLGGSELTKIHYLVLYTASFSVRAYFTVHGNTVWMVALDVQKRRTKMTQGMTDKLKDRLRWVLAQ
jgi:hypothetical protein